MSVNKYKPHLFIIPEDDADRQIAVGFELRGNIKARSLQIVNTAGGWLKVIDLIETEYIPILKKYPKSQVLGIIDCDNHPERIIESLNRFPEEFRDRIFLIGTLKDPQELKKNVNLSFERIGEDLGGRMSQWKSRYLER